MALNTGIEWADDTINLWWGCEKIPNNPCCDFCYADLVDKRFGGGASHWGADAPRRIVKGAWSNLRKYQSMARKTGKTRLVFSMSMGDLFERPRPLVYSEGNPVEGSTADLRNKFLDAVDEGRYPHLTFLALTKRPSNVMKMVPRSWMHSWPSNFWVGISAGDQENWNVLVPKLLTIPAPVRFVSIEPLFEKIALGDIMKPGKSLGGNFTKPGFKGSRWCSLCGGLFDRTSRRDIHDCSNPSIGIDWVICGGESGIKSRPTAPEWVRPIRDWCLEKDVPFFFKQWGKWLPFGQDESSALDLSKIQPVATNSGYFYDVGKKYSGNLIDGKQYLQFPKSETDFL